MLQAILSILCAVDNGTDLTTITRYVRGYWIRMVKQEDVAAQLDALVRAGVLMRQGNRFLIVDHIPPKLTHVPINDLLNAFVKENTPQKSPDSTV